MPSFHQSQVRLPATHSAVTTSINSIIGKWVLILHPTCCGNLKGCNIELKPNPSLIGLQESQVFIKQQHYWWFHYTWIRYKVKGDLSGVLVRGEGGLTRLWVTFYYHCLLLVVLPHVYSWANTVDFYSVFLGLYLNDIIAFPSSPAYFDCSTLCLNDSPVLLQVTPWLNLCPFGLFSIFLSLQFWNEQEGYDNDWLNFNTDVKFHLAIHFSLLCLTQVSQISSKIDHLECSTIFNILR